MWSLQTMAAAETSSSETIILEYYPIPKIEVIRSDVFTGSMDKLFGWLWRAMQVIGSTRIRVLQNGTYFYPSPNSISSINSPEFLAGITLANKNLGVASEIGMMDIPEPNHQIFGPPSDGTSEYTIVPIIYLQSLLPANAYSTLHATLDECFQLGDTISVIIPSLLTVAAADSNYNTIIGCTMATPRLLGLPSTFQMPNTWMIYNVCSNSKYRNQGITRSLLIAQINRAISLGATAFLLEVDPKNAPAIKLYSGLGFYKVGRSTDREADIYYVPTITEIPLPRIE